MQLAKLDNPPSQTLKADEISAIWSKIPKDKVIQFKLKVDLSQEVQVKVGDGALTGGDSNRSKTEVFNTVKGAIADKMIRDDREEAKEKNDV